MAQMSFCFHTHFNRVPGGASSVNAPTDTDDGRASIWERHCELCGRFSNEKICNLYNWTLKCNKEGTKCGCCYSGVGEYSPYSCVDVDLARFCIRRSCFDQGKCMGAFSDCSDCKERYHCTFWPHECPSCKDGYYKRLSPKSECICCPEGYMGVDPSKCYLNK